jgi:hypothetical protein
MGPYLNSLKEESGNLNIVQVITPDLQAGDKLVGLPSPQAFLAGNEPYYADFVIVGEPGRLFILGISQIQSTEANNPVLGWVLVARELKADYMVTLESETGLAQSLILNQPCGLKRPARPAAPWVLLWIKPIMLD